MALDRRSNAQLLVEFLGRVVSVKFIEFSWRVLVQELIDAEVTATHANVDLILVNFDAHTLAAKLVDAFALTHKHDLELLAVRVVIDVLSDFFVDLVILNGDVDSDTRFKINDVVAKHFNFVLHLFARPLRRR